MRQGPAARQLAAKSVGDEPADIVERERRQCDLVNLNSGLADRLERPQKRVRGDDLVVSIAPDQKQVPHLRVRDQVLQQVERRRIQPLQIVKKQRKRVLLPREYAEEAPENRLEAVLSIAWRQVHDRRLLPDDEGELGNQVGDQLAVRTQCLLENGPPPSKRSLALAQKRADEALESLGQGGVRDVALVLVELTGREEAAQRDEGLVQLVHDGGFADTGIPGYEHEL